MSEYTEIILIWILLVLNISDGKHTKILFSSQHGIQEYDMENGGITDLVNNSMAYYSYAIDYDDHGFVYCSSPHTNFINKFRYPSDDYLTHTIVTTENKTDVFDMVIDPVSDHMYWLEGRKGRIQRSDLNGRNIATVLSLGFTSTFDIDIQHRWMYFSVGNESICRFQRSRLNGNDIHTLGEYTADGPVFSLRKDPNGDRLYWMEFEKGNLKSAALDGSDVKQLFSTNVKSSFYSLDVYGDHIYLCYNSLIVRIHKHLEDEITVIYNATEKSQMLYALRIYQEKESCLLPYQKIGDGCYFISNDSVSGDEAFAQCIQPGTYLANFETIEEAMVMKLFLQQMNTGMHYFIGGRNINRYLPNGDWRWIRNGNATRMTYFAFGRGQPGGSANDEQDCMVFYAQARYKFYDVSCDHNNYHGGYICEK